MPLFLRRSVALGKNAGKMPFEAQGKPALLRKLWPIEETERAATDYIARTWGAAGCAPTRKRRFIAVVQQYGSVTAKGFDHVNAGGARCGPC
jgi:hypothetical protein